MTTELASKTVIDGSRPMLRTAYSLMLNTVVNAILGVGFWIVAARLFPESVVGRDGALISAMAAISALCGLNMNNTLIRFLPTRRTRSRRLVLAGYSSSALGVAAGAAGFVLIVPAISSQFSVLRDRPGFALFYGFSVVAWTVFSLQDVVLTSVRRAEWVPIENAVYGVAKLALLPVLSRLGVRDGILVAWILPMLVLILPVNGLIFGRLLGHHERSPWQAREPVVRHGRRGLMKFVARDAIGTACGLASRTLLPLLAVTFVGSRDAAHFYMPFQIVSTVDLLFSNVTTSLVAEGARHEVPLRTLVRTTLRRFLPLLLVTVCVLVAAAPIVLAVFGAGYAKGGANVLRLLALGSLFRAVMMTGIAVSRLRRTGTGSIVIQGGAALLLAGFLALLAPPLGLDGVGLAWLASSVLGGLLTLPYVLDAGHLPHPWSRRRPGGAA